MHGCLWWLVVSLGSKVLAGIFQKAFPAPPPPPPLLPEERAARDRFEKDMTDFYDKHGYLPDYD